MILLVFLVNFLFAYYFYQIGFWYVGILPVAVAFFFVSDSLVKRDEGIDVLQSLEEYSLMIARFMMLAGLVGLLSFGGIDFGYSGIALIFLNGGLWMGSVVFNYDEGKDIFHRSFLLLSGLFFVFHAVQMPSQALQLAQAISSLILGVYATVIFGLGNFFEYQKSIQNNFFLVVVGSLILSVISTSSHNFILGGILAQSVFTMILLSVRYLQWYQENINDEEEIHLGIDDLLAGARFDEIVQAPKIGRISYLHDFRLELPNSYKNILSLLNVLLVVFVIGFSLYKPSFGGNIMIQRQILFWSAIVLFMANYQLSKKTDCNPELQRVAVFGVINIAVYSSMIKFWGFETVPLIAGSLFWTTINVMAFLSSQKRVEEKSLTFADITAWFGAQTITMLINILLLLRLSIPIQLKFSFVFFYCGICGIALMYLIRALRKFTQNSESEYDDGEDEEYEEEVEEYEEMDE